MSNPLLWAKGTILVAPGGGGAMTALPPPAANQYLGGDPSDPLGVAWGAGNSNGNVVGPSGAVSGNLASYADDTGLLLSDSGIAPDTVAIGPGSSTAHNFASFNDTDGITLADSGFSAVSFLAALVTTSGAATGGSFTLSSGTHTQIATTAAVTGCSLIYTVTALGTVTVASAFKTTIDNGVGFTPVASQSSDTSVVTWAILPPA